MTSNMNTPLFYVTTGGKLKLKGGTLSNRMQIGLVDNGGVIVVEDGTYTSSVAEVFRASVHGTVIVNDGNLTGREGAVTTRGKGPDNECGAVILINGGHLTGTDNFAVATNGSAGMGHNIVTVNGGVLEGNIVSAGYEAIGVYIASEGDVFTMNGGEIIANGGTGICQRGGSVTINSGTITATGMDKNGNLVADGKVGDHSAVLTGVSAIVFHQTANYPGSATMSLTINGGTVNGVDHSIQILSNEAKPNVTITGGTLNPAVDQIYDGNGSESGEDWIFDSNPDGSEGSVYDSNP